MNENNTNGGAQTGSTPNSNNQFNNQNGGGMNSASEGSINGNTNGASNSASNSASSGAQNKSADMNPQFTGMPNTHDSVSHLPNKPDAIQAELSKTEHITVDLPGATLIPPNINPAPKPVMAPVTPPVVTHTSTTSSTYANSTPPVVPKPLFSTPTAHTNPNPNINPALVSSKTSSYANGGSDSHNKIWTIAGISALIIILIGAGAYWFMNRNADENPGSPTATSTKPSVTSTKPGAPKPVTNAPVKPNTGTPFTNTPTAATTREKISAYIRQNINTLSPVKGSPAFVVDEITFDGPDRALVRYSNNRDSYIAAVVAVVDASGNVRVTSFTILEK